MEIHMSDMVTVETDVPLLEIREFHSLWKWNQHGGLVLKGLLDSNAVFRAEDLYESRVTVRKKGGEIIFCGYLINMEIKAVGNMKYVILEITTGSGMLDRRRKSRSFQNVTCTYEDIVRESVESASGRVICTVGSDAAIERPIIQYQETDWEFAKRIASHLGTYITADIETGNANIWFGIPEGNEISSFPAEDYKVHIQLNKNGNGEKQIIFEVSSSESYQLGDTTTFWGQSVMIYEVQAAFRHGDLVFTYLLSTKMESAMIYHENFTGMELFGTVEDVREEQIKLAFEIDGNSSTGDYYYEWYPETGNGMYAMPEKGSRIYMTFGSADEREGFATRSMLTGTGEKLDYQNRSLMTKDKNTILLNEAEVCISGNEEHKFLLCDAVYLNTPNKLRIRAAKSITFEARDIQIKTLDVIKLNQG